MTRLDTIRHKIKKAYRKRHNWRDVGAEFGITGGMAYRIAMDGYEPKRASIRVKLGLPAFLPAPVCPKCGVVHVAKRCTARRKPKHKPLISSSLAELLWMLDHRQHYN
jgi:hypothetical protein